MARVQTNLDIRETGGIPPSLVAPRAFEPVTARRVVIGYNHQIPYQGRVYHVQTEDSGRTKGHIFTHVFHAGVIVASSRVDYDETKLDIEIADLLKRSHKSMLRKLVRGILDEAIARCLGPANSGNERRALPPADARQEHGEQGDVAPRDPPPGRPRERPEHPTDQSISLERQRQALTESLDMDNINQVLENLLGNVSGALAAALVDYESGMCLGSAGHGINIEVAAAGNMEVMKAKTRVMKDLGIKGGIEDILITLESQYHIIRPIGTSLFMYLAFDKKTGNLALARHKMNAAAAEVKV